LICSSFNESLESDQCNEMCDHCDCNQGTVKKVDVTQYARQLLAVLHQASSADQRVTGLKLVEAWLGKGSVALRVPGGVVPKLSRGDAEQVVINLLLNGYLREDFHFTPYSTISYLLPGSRATQLESTNHAIIQEFTSANSANKQLHKSLKKGDSCSNNSFQSSSPVHFYNGGSNTGAAENIDSSGTVSSSKSIDSFKVLKNATDDLNLSNSEGRTKKRKLSSVASTLTISDDDDNNDDNNDVGKCPSDGDSDDFVSSKRSKPKAAVIVSDDDSQ